MNTELEKLQRQAAKVEKFAKVARIIWFVSTVIFWISVIIQHIH